MLRRRAPPARPSALSFAAASSAYHDAKPSFAQRSARRPPSNQAWAVSWSDDERVGVVGDLDRSRRRGRSGRRRPSSALADRLGHDERPARRSTAGRSPSARTGRPCSTSPPVRSAQAGSSGQARIVTSSGSAADLDGPRRLRERARSVGDEVGEERQRLGERAGRVDRAGRRRRSSACRAGPTGRRSCSRAGRRRSRVLPGVAVAGVRPRPERDEARPDPASSASARRPGP